MNLTFIILWVVVLKSSVCLGSIWDFFTSTSNLELSEDGYLSTVEFLNKYGYNYEEHYPVTPDGYVLKIHRIRGKKGSPDIPANAPTVLMMPGICNCDINFVLNGPGKALGISFADEGFDVWMGNNRGSRFCRNHTSLSVDDPNFWKFDVYEQTVIDIPTIIDYILDNVNKEKLHYFGFSLGGIGINYALSLKPQYNEKIKSLTYVQAALSFKNTRSIPFKIVGRLLKPFAQQLPHLNIPVLVYTKEEVDSIYNNYRRNMFFYYAFMMTLFELSLGPYGNGFNRNRFAVYSAQTLSGCPVGVGLEMSQGIFFNDFRMFDAGREGNLAKYGTVDVPIINASAILPPKIMFYGGKDILVTKEDILLMASKMPNVKQIIGMDEYNHGMPVLNDDAYEKIVVPTAEHIRAFE